MSTEKAIERARKLMAMAADSSSPNEAAIAARRARAIMDEHQLNSSDLVEESEFGTATAGKPRSRVPLWEQTLCICIANLNDCIARFDRDRRIIFSGFEEDAAVCEFMFAYLTENGKRTCQEYMRKDTQGCRNSFKRGYAFAIRDKINNMIETRKAELKTSTGTSLVLMKKSLVEREFGKAKYQEKWSRSEIVPLSAQEGRKAGNKTNIVTGVETQKRPSLPAT